MYQVIYEDLIRVARDRRVGVTTYGELARLVHLHLENPADRKQLRDVLDQINRYEHSQGHPMLSSVVVYVDKNRPGDGFFTLARELGLYGGGNNEESKISFWTAELRRVHDFWRREL
jgi:hypothetical protein